jgi:gliding motility-associated-like protein
MSYTIDLTVPGADYYSYTWLPPTYVSNDTIPNPIITPTVAGLHVYTVVVSPRALGCDAYNILNLYVMPNTIDLLTPDTAICKGQSVQILASGHSLFEYQWLPTTGIAVSNVVAPFITPDTSALYKVKVSYHRCPDFYDSVMIDVQPIPNVYIGGNRFVCEFDTVRLISSVTPGWYDNYSYTWTPASGLSATGDPAVFFTGIDTGTVILTVTTPAGCTGVDSARMLVLPGNFATMQPELEFCPHDSAILVPEGGVSYQWSPAMYLSSDKAAQPIIKPITTQTYSIVATSSYGCKDTLYFKAIVHPAAVVFLEDSARLHLGEQYQIDPQSNCTIFSWSPSGGLNGRYLMNPIATPEVSTKYVVRAATENGCKAVDSINVIVDYETLIDLPNAFSPGSGVNNEFKIIKRGIANLNYFRIFNRWGNMVFETTNIDEGWDGTYKGVPQNIGVFVYQVQAVTQSGKIFTKQGNVTLLR